MSQGKPGARKPYERPRAVRVQLWLGRPMVDEQTAGPLTLYHDERRERWFVRVGDPITGGLVTFGKDENIDAKTRAWLAPLAKLIGELR